MLTRRISMLINDRCGQIDPQTTAKQTTDGWVLEGRIQAVSRTKSKTHSSYTREEISKALYRHEKSAVDYELTSAVSLPYASLDLQCRISKWGRVRFKPISTVPLEQSTSRTHLGSEEHIQTSSGAAHATEQLATVDTLIMNSRARIWT